VTKSISVSLVDDDLAVLENWAELINRSQTVRCLNTYATAKEALRDIPQNPPSVVLMDINLPHMSGIECTARLKALRPELCIVMLTTFSDNESIFNALRAGASGYLLKRITGEELVQAIEEVHHGGAPMSSQIAQQVVRYFHSQKQSAPDTETLTAREQELVSLLAKGRHYKEIGDALHISTDTVRSHIRRVYEKLHVHSRTEAVLKFLGTSPRGPETRPP
jgi:DNA-binding NarL/FixJ family response regulator